MLIKDIFKNIKCYKKITSTLIVTFVICQLVTILIAVGYKNACLSFIKENNGLNKTSIEMKCIPSLTDTSYIIPVLKEVDGDIHLRLLGNLNVQDFLGAPRVLLELYKGSIKPVELPLIKGTNLDYNDIKNNNNVVLVGKHIIENLKNKDNIVINGDDYNVKGVLGTKRYKTELDNYLVLLLNTIDKKMEDELLISGEFNIIINGNGNELDIAKKIESNIKKYDENAKIQLKDIEKNKNILLYIFGDNKYFQVLLIMTYVLSIIACTYIVNYWIKTMEKKISIRIAFGSNIKDTIKYVLLNIIGISIIATILSIIIILIINPLLSKYNDINFGLYLDNIIIAFLISLINSLIILAINLFKIIKINPAININKF